MNDQGIKDTHEEMTDAIRRHNEAVADRITAEFARPEKISALDSDQWYAEIIKNFEAQRNMIEDATNRQRAQIQRALEALHKGNLDDVKRILEEI